MPEAPVPSPDISSKLDASPLNALLLRVSTTDRIALEAVLNIRTTQKAVDALAALQEFPADVVIADIGTSDFETTDLLQALRDPVKTPRKGIPIICLLSESSPDRVRSLVKSGVDHVMVKPISATALRELAQHLCDFPMKQVTVYRYVGPDRRRVPDNSYPGPSRRKSE